MKLSEVIKAVSYNLNEGFINADGDIRITYNWIDEEVDIQFSYMCLESFADGTCIVSLPKYGWLPNSKAHKGFGLESLG